MLLILTLLYRFTIVYISGKVAPSSVKLDPLFITKKDRIDSENISSKTKEEIMLKMKEMDLDAIEIFVAEDIEVGKVIF